LVLLKFFLSGYYSDIDNIATHSGIWQLTVGCDNSQWDVTTHSGMWQLTVGCDNSQWDVDNSQWDVSNSQWDVTTHSGMWQLTMGYDNYCTGSVLQKTKEGSETSLC
jgi:hypothetical protein